MCVLREPVQKGVLLQRLLRFYRFIESPGQILLRFLLLRLLPQPLQFLFLEPLFNIEVKNQIVFVQVINIRLRHRRLVL